ncbi:uncharacterized protein KY384_000642 [Bacidia gigantensis]|uniref:uncharacterized protein n=1 Tax=Bacidia gigantensis TaxID=2732470 RepID=UPI001D03C85B|nr:uncharacterized protein KY384_000642 [Bacidia gigantensis]KAG8525882.1 hypothetical protein KY384_000642 [Bacidia gigantensis]
MRYILTALVGLVAVQQAAACDTCDWNQANPFPDLCDDKCDTQKKNGIDLSQLPLGSIGQVGNFHFSGCDIGQLGGSSQKQQRDFVPRGASWKRWGTDKGNDQGKDKHAASGQGQSSPQQSQPSSGAKCAKGPATSNGGPAFASPQKFTIDHVKASCDKDNTPVVFHYKYTNKDSPKYGQTCFHPATLHSGEAQPIPNTQCGGADQVECRLPEDQKQQQPCQVAFHSIGFNCNQCPKKTPSSSPPSLPPSKTPSKPVTPPPSSPPFPPPPGTSPKSPPPGTSPPPPPPGTSPPPPPPPGTSPPPPGTSPPPPGTSPPPPGTSPPPPPPGTSPPPSNTPPQSPPSNTPPPPPPPSNSPPPPPSSPPTPPKNSTLPPGTAPVPPSSVPPKSETTPESPQTPTSPVSPPPSESTPQSPQTPTVPVSQSTVPVVTTEIVYTTVTSCSETKTISSAGSTIVKVIPTISTVVVTSTKTVCTKCVQPPQTESPHKETSSIPSSPQQSNSPQQPNSPQQSNSPQQPTTPNSPEQPKTPEQPPPPANAPGLLPSCLQTWLTLTKCKDNSDTDCFCKDNKFTENVQGCVNSWAQHADEQQSALSFLVAICAQHVPQNPGLVAHVPSTITLAPTPFSSPQNSPVQPPAQAPAQPAAAGQTPSPAPATPQGTNQAPAAAPAAPIPSTVITVSATIPVACPSATGGVSQQADGQPIQAGAGVMPSGSCTSNSAINTVVTVPQVAFQTSSSAVGLVAGPTAPAPAPAVPSGSSAASPSSGVSPPSPTGTNVTPFTGAASKAGTNSVLLVVIAALGLAILA